MFKNELFLKVNRETEVTTVAKVIIQICKFFWYIHEYSVVLLHKHLYYNYDKDKANSMPESRIRSPTQLS